jgi:hypothetical protein
MDLKEFEVQRLTNGRGESHLVVITEPAIEDVVIGSVVIVPYADGFKDPKAVILQVDDNGKPKTANDIFAIVNEYVYEW